MAGPLVPVLVTIGTGLLLLSQRKPAAAAPPSPGPQPPLPPIPRPHDLPPPQPPSPTPNLDVLRQQMNQLLAQADVDPNMDPNQLDALAATLAAAGLAPEAATVAAKAAELHLKRGDLPLPVPGFTNPVQGSPPGVTPGFLPATAAGGFPSTLPPDLTARVAPYMIAGKTGLDPNAAVKLADYIDALYPGGFLTITSILRKRAAELGGAAGA